MYINLMKINVTFANVLAPTVFSVNVSVKCCQFDCFKTFVKATSSSISSSLLLTFMSL